MDSNLIFVKTQVGDEAVRQSTRVVQRNLRMVLVQVDGSLSVGELSAKIGNPRLVERALRELEEGGFIAPRQGAVLIRAEGASPDNVVVEKRVISQFSTFGERPAAQVASVAPLGRTDANSQFSSFGKPILPASGRNTPPPVVEETKFERKPVIKKSRDEGRPIQWGRWLLGVPLGLLLLALLVVLVYPYNNFKPGIETAASKMLQVPVRIGNVGVTFWPRPALTLSSLVLGEGADGSIEQVRIASPLSLLSAEQHRLPGVQIIGSSVSADFLASSDLFKMSTANTDGVLLLSQVSVERLSVLARDLAVRDLAGEFVFKDDGKLEKATLKNDDLGLRLLAVPAPDGILLDIQGSGWKPLGKALGFDSLQAKGLLRKGKLVIQSVDTTFLNGILKGSWLLDWSKDNLSMAGDASLQRLDCRKVTAALVPSLSLEGELSGNLRLRASGKDWDGLWNGVEANLDADIVHGILHGTDIGDAVRGGNGFIVRSGSTKFDRLRTSLTIDPKQIFGRNLQMSAGMLNASGQFVAGRGRGLDANLLVTMQTSVTTVRSSVRVTGELPNLIAVSGK